MKKHRFAFLFLVMACCAPAQAEPIITNSATWKFFIGTSEASTPIQAWRTNVFDDSSWLTGTAPIGDPSTPADDPNGWEARIATTVPQGTLCVFFRKTFNISNPASISQLDLSVIIDDGFVAWINGMEVNRFNMTAPPGTDPLITDLATAAGESTESTVSITSNLGTLLHPGVNVLAIQAFNANSTSSDFIMEASLTSQVDNVPPVASYDPLPGSTLQGLTLVNVLFNEGVTGVNASDLLINGVGATSVVTNNLNDYSFHFSQPPTGAVSVAWVFNHDITDLAQPGNPFAGGGFTYTLDTNVANRANFVISEFMADNGSGIRDDDGKHSDWIEVANFGTLAGSLSGFYLTDTPTNLTQWQFPAGLAALQPNNYLIVWASANNHTNPSAQLHANFKLAKETNSFLALVDPTGSNIVSSFTYPDQVEDVSYGRDPVDPNLVGYYNVPTPGKQNSTSGTGFVTSPIFSLDSGIYTNASLTVTLSLSNAPVGSTIRYLLNPLSATNLPTTGSTLYTGPITISNSTVIKARVFPPAGSPLFPSTVVARNFIFLDDTDKDFNSNLPLIIISTQGQGIPASVAPGGQRAEGTIAIIDTFRGRSSVRDVPEFEGMAAFEVFGQTSAGFPKLPIRIEIHDALGNDQKVPVLGLPADSDFRLRNPFDDKTYLNDFLGYELFEKMGHYSCRRRLVEVFIDSGGGRLNYNADYYGIMVLFETIKVSSSRVDIPSLTPYDTAGTDVTGGYIFKKDKDSGGDINFSTSGNGTLGFAAELLKIHEPKAQSLRTVPVTGGTITSFPGAGYTTSGSNQLNYLRNYLNRMEQALYATDWLTASGTNHYSYYMDVDAFVDFHWLVEFTKQIDGIRLSSYFTKDRNGKVMPGPCWDWNLSFGNANYLRGGQTNGWYFAEQDQGMTSNEDIWLRRLRNGAAAMGANNALGAGGDPDFNQKIVDRWCVLRNSIMNGTNVLREVDDLSTMLSEAANRDAWGPTGKYRSSIVGIYQWPNPNGTADGRDVDYQNPTNYIGNATNSIIGQMKKWILGRYLWIDSQFTPQPTFSAADSQVTNGFVVTVTPPQFGRIYFTLDGTDPRAPGGGVMPGVFSNTGPFNITISNNVRIAARVVQTSAWYVPWSGPSAITLFTAIPPLRITEIMYHPLPPPAGGTNSAEDFEFIEVKNTSGTSLNVNRFSLNGGVQFQFPNVTLTNGQSAVIVANVAAFQSRYPGFAGVLLGAYTGNLNNGGDHIVLLGNLQEGILDFSYQDAWYPATDGFGFSLVVVDENAPTSAWRTPGNWRPSSAVGGSPGANDPIPPLRPAVLVNEALTRTDVTGVDAIELHNPTASPADIGGWFLTDDLQTPKKFVIPPTTIPSGGFAVFTENDFNNTNSPNDLKAFALSAKGEQVYLFSGNGTDLTGYAHGFDFGAAANAVTFGRYVTSVGEQHFVAQATNTLGLTNRAPLVGPIVVSEINYHPADVAAGGIGFNDTEDEFIELQNISTNAVPLYDVTNTVNTWHLRDAVDFDFPTGVSVPPGGYLLVVSFDPANPAALAAFRARNFVPGTVPVYGPWTGELDNKSDRIELLRPDAPDTNGVVSYILVERVAYSDEAPWPVSADGLGLSLQRLAPAAYGNDPANWAAGAPSFGGSFVGGAPPAILSQPGSFTALKDSDVILSSSVTGTAPLRYQWRYGGLNLANATNATLTLTNVQISQSGTYNLFVFNGGGSTLGTNFILNVRQGIKITSNPTNRIAQVGQTTNFIVSALGTGTLRYQWRFGAANIPNATNATLTLTNVQQANEGTYSAVVTDDFDTLFSQPATLTLIYKAAVAQNPQSVTVLQGQSATLNASATGTLPLSFRWRKNPGGLTLTNFILFASNSTFTITNVQLSFNPAFPNALTNGSQITVAVTNIGGAAALSSVAVLTVLADNDLDGIADDWERLYGFSTNSLADASVDSDLDGMTNYQEYLAGTDPTNALSYLKIDAAPLGGGPPASLLLTLSAVSNHTYSVICRDNVIGGPWLRLADIDARLTNRVVTVTNVLPAGVTNRFYRLQTPQLP